MSNIGDLSKAHLSTNGQHLNISMPISKVDKERRIVSGFATLDNLDRQDDIVPAEVSLKAFNNFRGNIREMHQPVAVGKMVSFKEEKYYNKEDGKFYNGIYVSAYVSKGAQDTWEKVLDGTLTGFSIGGNINDFEDSYDSKMDKAIRVIKDYDLNELSLVDSPANQFANIVSVEKGVMTGYVTKANIENVYWCNTDDLISISNNADASCPRCDKGMSNIGFVESNDVEKSQAVRTLVNDARQRASMNFQKNDYVVLDQNVFGRILDIQKSGDFQMSSSNTILKATEYDPVALIQLYSRNDGIIMPTDRQTIKFVSSLDTVEVVAKNSKEVEKMSNNVVIVNEDINKAQQFEQSSLRSQDEPENPPRQEGFTESHTDSTEVTETKKEVSHNDDVESDSAAVNKEVKDEDEESMDKADGMKEDEELEEDDEDTEKGMNMPMAYADGMEKPAVQEVKADGNTTIPRHEMNGYENPPVEPDQPKGMNMPMAYADGYNEEMYASSKAVGEMVATMNTLADIVKNLSEKVEGLHKDITGVSSTVDNMKNEFGKRVDAVEDATAFRKSGDLGEIVQEPDIRVQKSLWDGRFLSTSNIFK